MISLFYYVFQLLDQCSGSTFLANPKKSPNIRPIAQKLYNNFGQEIPSVYDLETDMEVWLSFGEPWKNPFSKGPPAIIVLQRSLT